MYKKNNGSDPLAIDQLLPKKSQAKAAGHTHYFTGVPCKHGHTSPRYTSSGQCVSCQHLAYKKRYKKSTKPKEDLTEEEKLLRRKKYRQQYWIDNKERLSRLHTEWYRKNRKKENERDRKRYRKNREKVIARVKAYYKENREEILEKKRQYRAGNKDKIKEQNRKYYLKKKKEREEALKLEAKGA